jgi:hypothetical protein
VTSRSYPKPEANRISGCSPYARSRALCIYLAVIAAGNLAWESLHLPLYTLWRTGTRGEQAFAVIHCTGGDLMIALASLILALITVGDRRWPASRYLRVAVTAVVFGLAYTIFSEWLNVAARGTWTYSELMPVLPLFSFNLGLSPILQWIIVPGFGFGITRPMTGGTTEAHHDPILEPNEPQE